MIKEKILFRLGHHLKGTPFTDIDGEEKHLGHQKDTIQRTYLFISQKKRESS